MRLRKRVRTRGRDIARQASIIPDRVSKLGGASGAPRAPLCPGFRKMRLEPQRRLFGDLIQRSRLLEKVGGAVNQCHLTGVKPLERSLIHLYNGMVERAHDEKGGSSHFGKSRGRKIRPTATRNDRGNPRPQIGSSPECRRSSRARAKVSNWNFGFQSAPLELSGQLDSRSSQAPSQKGNIENPRAIRLFILGQKIKKQSREPRIVEL